MSEPIATTVINLPTTEWEETQGREVVDDCSNAVVASKDGETRVIIAGYYDSAEELIQIVKNREDVTIEFDSSPKSMEVAKKAPFSYDPGKDYYTEPDR